MFFNEKGNTNIDDQFKDSDTLNLRLSLENPKTKLLIGLGIVLLIAIIVIIIVAVVNNANKPTIELLGEETIKITMESEYFEPGYKAYDKKGNDLTDKVKITNKIDTSKKGEYEVIYSVKNAKAIRKVTVIDTIDETFIKLNGEINMNIVVGEKYIEPGYQVYDSIDKDSLNDKVKINGSVDTSKAGTYQITYSVVNSRGVTTTVKRTIFVRVNNEK